MQYFALDKLINLYDGYRQVFVVNRKEVLLIQEQGQRYALQASCPHKHWPLLSAPIQNKTIQCSKHGWAFDLITGKAANDCAQCDLKTYTISYEDNTIGIVIDREQLSL